MCSRSDRNPVAGQVESELRTDSADVGKPLGDKRLFHVSQVEIHTGVLRFLHLFGDRLADDVSRGELFQFVVVGHEPVPVAVDQVRVLAPNSFGNQVPCAAGDVEDRRVKLHELHVAQQSPRAKRDRVAVGSGDLRIRRFAKESPCPARCKDDLLRPHDRLAVLLVPHESSDAASFVSQQIDRERLFPGLTRIATADGVDHRPHDFPSGGITQRVRDSTVRMSALPRERDLSVLFVKLRPVQNEFTNPLGGFPNDHIDNVFIAQSLAGGDRVGRVNRHIVERVEHRRDAALSVRAVGLSQLVLRHHDHAERRIDLQSRACPRDAAADDQHVRKHVRHPLRREANQIPPSRIDRQT